MTHKTDLDKQSLHVTLSVRRYSVGGYYNGWLTNRQGACRITQFTASVSAFKQRLSLLGFSSYNQYLSSPHWRLLGEELEKSKAHRSCVICGSASHIQKHHRTYVRLGCELLLDLIPLCSACHHKSHDEAELQGIPLYDMRAIATAVHGSYTNGVKKRLKPFFFDGQKSIPSSIRDLRAMVKSFGLEACEMQHSRLLPAIPFPDFNKMTDRFEAYSYCQMLSGQTQRRLAKKGSLADRVKTRREFFDAFAKQGL